MILRHSYISARPKGGRVSKASLGCALGTALAHVKYLQHRPGHDREKGGRKFLDEYGEHIDSSAVRNEIREMGTKGVVIHKLMLAPDVSPHDPVEFTREVLHRLESQKGLDLRWRSVIHRNTDHHHIHVVVYGKDRNGKEVRFNKKDYERLKTFADEWLDRNHPIEREQMRYVKEQKYDKTIEQERIARHAYNQRHYIEPQKYEALFQIYPDTVREHLSKHHKDKNIEHRAEQVLRTQQKDLQLNHARGQCGDPIGGRWVSSVQTSASSSRAFSMFQTVASICNELVRSIELVDKRDPLQLAKDNLKDRRKELLYAWYQLKHSPCRAKLEELIDQTDKALCRIEEAERQHRKDANRDKRDKDLEFFGD